jgi:putative addiction module component (TIGR02574 family)
MSTALDKIVKEARQLPRAQLAELIDLLTLELHEEIDPEIETAWADEAERRLAEIRSGQVQPVPGDQVMTELRQRAAR